MAINMKTVKAITHNNKSLKNIKDSNGNIIWGSQADYPYRRLEYLQGNNITYGFDTGTKPQLNSYMRLDIAFINDPAVVNNSWQIGRGAVYQNQRFAVGASRSNNQIVLFGGIGSNWNTYTNVVLGETKHTLTVQGPNSTKFGSGQGYSVDSTFYSTSNTVNNPGAWYSVYLFGSRGNTNDTSAMQGAVSSKLYYAEVGYQSSFNGKFVPCQRKSDGQLGIMKIDNQGNTTFLTPRTGETGTYTAGPVQDEYWDLSV